MRERVILRNAADDGSQRCPHLSESQPCRRGATCWQYHWEYSDSNVCVLNEGSLCGTGRTEHFRVCVRSEDSRPVSDMHCQEVDCFLLIEIMQRAKGRDNWLLAAL